MMSTITLDEIRKEIDSLPDLSKKQLDDEAMSVMQLAAKKSVPTDDTAAMLRKAGYAFGSGAFRRLYREMKRI